MGTFFYHCTKKLFHHMLAVFSHSTEPADNSKGLGRGHHQCGFRSTCPAGRKNSKAWIKHKQRPAVFVPSDPRGFKAALMLSGVTSRKPVRAGKHGAP